MQGRPVLRNGAYRLGFVLSLQYKKYGPLAAISLAGGRTWEVTKAIGASLGRIVTGSGRKDVASPVGIVQASSETCRCPTMTLTTVFQFSACHFRAR